jgi:transketolase
MLSLPQLNSPLTPDQLKFLETFAKSCRYSAIAMLNNSQSGHSGGSMSGLDYLSLLYSFIISQTGEKVVVSNGHISPAVYSVLAEMGYIPKNEVIANFRKIGSRFEGHITRQVDGVWYGTGPLGIGASVAEGFALAQKLRKEGGKVYALIGDGEAEEGQIYEMMQSADKYQLDNLIVFVDFNQVQLSGSLKQMVMNFLKCGKFWEKLRQFRIIR